MEKRQRFTAEFKREAGRQVREGGKQVSALARELGVPRNRLYKWVADAEKLGASAFGGSGTPRIRGRRNYSLQTDNSSVPLFPYSTDLAQERQRTRVGVDAVGQLFRRHRVETAIGLLGALSHWNLLPGIVAVGGRSRETGVRAHVA